MSENEISVTRRWARDGSRNKMPLRAAVANLLHARPGLTAEAAEQILCSGVAVETAHAALYLSDHVPQRILRLSGEIEPLSAYAESLPDTAA